jgi:ATP-binding cassette subfamily F protein 3
MIVVSHDRYFLDKVTTRTLELFDGTVDGYTGNFSAYWQQKAQRVLVERRTYEKQQEEIEKTKDFIRRNAYGQKHAQAEDRRKKLERIELVARPREVAEPPMRFSAADRSGDIVVRAERLGKSYAGRLFADVNLDIVRGQRWALLGPNGCGKTTLVRCLLGLVEPDEGEARLGQGVTVGYFDQQLAGLEDDWAVVDAVRPPHKLLSQEQRRGLLARFGLNGETALQKVGSLSGGERCRAALARLAALDANFLVLDEPTNHLDLWACDALEKAILEFEGTVLLVSHDRYFINCVADHVAMIELGRLRIVEGNYDVYQQMARQAGDASPQGDGRGTGVQPVKGHGQDGPATPPPAGAEKSARKRRFPFRKLADLEDDIAAREMTLYRLQCELAEPRVLRDGQRVRELKAQLEAEQSTLKALYEHWEEAAELNW